MVHSYTMGESIDPQVLDFESFCEVQRGEGVVGALSKVEITLVVHVRHHIYLISCVFPRTKKVDALYESIK
jgi:hypothetical protein